MWISESINVRGTQDIGRGNLLISEAYRKFLGKCSA